jgi:large repetitive protein
VNALPHAGLTSDQSCDVDVTVYPDPPRITFTSLPGPTTSSTTVTVSGMGDAGDSVALYDGSHYLGSATVNPSGAWTLTVSLGVGGHSLTATQTWSSHLTSDASPAATVTVYAPPPAPSISTLPAGSLSPVTVSGSGVAGDTVTLYEGTTVLGAAVVGPGGSWALTVALGLGKHTFTAKQTDPVSGFTGSASSSASTTVYPQPAAPTITSVSTPAATKTTSPVTVAGGGVAGDKITLFDGSTAIGTVTVASNGGWSLIVQLAVGVHSLTATQTLVAAVTSTASAAVSVTVYPPPPAAPTIGASATATTSSSVTLSGSGVAGDTITVYDGTTVIGTTTVGAGGSWTLPASLVIGAHALSATQADPVWHLTSVKSSTVTVTVYAPPPPPLISSVAVGTVSHSSANVTLSGTGVAGETITIYDGSANVGTVTVAANGTWTRTVNLASGTHTITATQTLTAGVTGAASAPLTVVVPAH